MKVLITGGVGFIGSHLATALVSDGHKVLLFDNYDKQVHADMKPPRPRGTQVRRGDVLNAAALARVARDADAIFHFAAAVGVGQSQYRIRHYVDTNLTGTATLLEVLAARKKKPKKLIVAGSMSAYGEGAYRCAKCGRVRPPLRTGSSLQTPDSRPDSNTAGRSTFSRSPESGAGSRIPWDPCCPTCGGALQPLPTRESDRFVCNSIYAVTKMGQEELTMNFGAAYGIPSTTLRFFNVYGPGQSLSNPYTGVAAIFISRVRNGKPPAVYEDGGQTRDFVSIRDIVQSCRLVLEKKEADFEIFNVAAGRATSVLELARIIVRESGSALEPRVLGRFRSGDIRHCTADIEKIRSKLGFRPSVELREGIAELVAWSKGVKAVDRFDRAQKELSSRGLV